jgi:penicillin-binding protein 1A
MVVKIGARECDAEPADWAWTQHPKANDLAKVGDIVYVRVVSGGGTAESAGGAGAGQRSAGFDDGGGQLQRRGAGDGGRARLCALAVQPRDAGAAPGGVVVQAVCVYGGDGGGHEADGHVLDTPTTFNTPGGPYTPHNYEAGTLGGSMTLTDAFAESRNIPALRLADKVGIKKVIDVAHRFGVTSNIPAFLPVAIGAADITLAEQVGAYSVFPERRHTDCAALHPPRGRGGWIAHATGDSRGARGDLAGYRAQDDDAAAGGGAARNGGCASSMNHALGGKTGTTNNYTDAWFIGFSPSITCGTWIGFDDRAVAGRERDGSPSRAADVDGVYEGGDRGPSERRVLTAECAEEDDRTAAAAEPGYDSHRQACA